MKPVLQSREFSAAGKDQVGGKAWCLAKIGGRGISIPKTWCVPCAVYQDFISQTRLRDRIFLEINRKPFEQMRWEEIWDIALRIRNQFLTTPLPPEIRKDLADLIGSYCGEKPVAVRSSAPGEDGSAASFAGLHESFINISGTKDILKHIKLVWASLYSDAALLYRKELGLDIHTSRMAVVIQELIPSDRSGIFFGVNPSDAGESLLEAVYGLNQALVDGDIAPDRWHLHRSSGRIIRHESPVRERCAVTVPGGVAFTGLSPHQAGTPPLTDREVRRVWETGKQLETLFDRPQDVEWTFLGDRLIILQSRPITSTGFTGTDEKRAWYLTLHRSYENLQALHEKITRDLIPEMIAEAERLGRKPLADLSARDLCREIEERQKIYDHWVSVYWADFIPFAHGIRLFGQVYNDAVTPEDPYEFMALLEKTGLKSMERNQLLEELAEMIRSDADLRNRLESDLAPGPDHPFTRLLDTFIARFGDLSCTTGSGSECQYGAPAVIRLLMEFARRPAAGTKTSGSPHQRDTAVLKEQYVAGFPAHRRQFAQDLLHLGRESYRLRDDDNIHLGRIESRLFEAVQEGQRRLGDPATEEKDREMLARFPAITAAPAAPKQPEAPAADETAARRWYRSRQIVGQPAGPGIATGTARLVKTPQDLLSFKQGEILVCQGVDPNMTFVIPLASAVVEERGGMLIHGAIIAREYGLPCITGAPRAMQLIQDGTRITVDGYLGIITSHTKGL